MLYNPGRARPHTPSRADPSKVAGIAGPALSAYPLYYLSIAKRAWTRTCRWFGLNVTTVVTATALWAVGLAISVPLFLGGGALGFLLAMAVITVVSPIATALLFLLINVLLAPVELQHETRTELKRLRQIAARKGHSRDQLIFKLLEQHKQGQSLVRKKSMRNLPLLASWNGEMRAVIEEYIPEAEAFIYGEQDDGMRRPGQAWLEWFTPWRTHGQRLARLRQLIVTVTKQTQQEAASHRAAPARAAAGGARG